MARHARKLSLESHPTGNLRNLGVSLISLSHNPKPISSSATAAALNVRSYLKPHNRPRIYERP
jgi:hypothetical protein